MRALLAIPLMLAAPVAAAQLRVVPGQPVSASAARQGVDVFLINDGAVPVVATLPARIEVIALDGARLAIVPLERPPASVPAQGVVRVRYISAGVLSVGPPPVAVAPVAPPTGEPLPPSPAPAPVAAPVRPMTTTDLPPSSVEPAPLPPPPGDPRAPRETAALSATGTASGFLDRFQPYQPTYGAIGVGDAGTKLQFSFALAPFGGDGALSHFRFAYTQTIFWATDQSSGPIRVTTYSPEAFAEFGVAPQTRLAIGYAHDSNGGGDLRSIDVNRVFVRAARRFDLGSNWYAEFAPQAWIYVGRGQVRDVQDYWGNVALNAAVGQDDGVRLAVTARGNPGTGRGAAEAFASYPLSRFGDLGVYLFAQGFTGYGEALDAFRVRDSHARFGIALTR
ncbi:phospholipase A [Sphingomonas donggukensis]|uniref:Phospholipase A1 n=1 Tax=Sphingomonas donggukensis TaxID=2949093 RepID=A0ABY4TT77_9SPHN|nr:phospholipase A [Sphingomonas donggukensis]URW75608.1 phospholipase A [Sphingomonas donggukensis]